MDTRTHVQFEDEKSVIMVSDTVPSPRDRNQLVVRVTVDLPVALGDFIDRYKEYKNALDAAQTGRPPRVKWKRKSVVEWLVTLAVEAEAEELKRAAIEIGPMPDHRNKKEMLKYAKRVLALQNKQ